MKQNLTFSCPNSLSPEMALVVACSRMAIDEVCKQEIHQRLLESLDWDIVIELAVHHKVLPFLHKTLVENFNERIPQKVNDSITSRIKQLSLYTFVVSASLTSVIKLLNDNHIDVLPVKGAVLAERLYNSIGMRTYADVDILISRKNIKKTISLLKQNDCTLLPEGIPDSIFYKLLNYNMHGKVLDKNCVVLEIHWELSGFYAAQLLTLEWFQTCLKASTFNDLNISELPDEMLLIYLCLHGSRHRWEKLDYIVSIVELIRVSKDLNWDSIIKVCNTLRMKKRMAIAMLLANNLFGIVIPEQFAKIMIDYKNLNSIANSVVMQQLSITTHLPRRHLIKVIKYQRLFFDSGVDFVRYISRMIFFPTEADWEKIQLPPMLFSMFIFLKPTRSFLGLFLKAFRDGDR